MPDINFLPEDFKKREEKERHRLDPRSKEDEVRSMHVPTPAPHTIDFAKSLEKKLEQSSVTQKSTSPFASVAAPVSGALTPTPHWSLKTWLNRVVAKMRTRVSEEPARILEQRVVSRPPASTATVPQKTSSRGAQRASFSKVAKNESRQDTQELVSVPQLPHSEGDVVVNLLPEQQVFVERIRKNVWLVILAGIGTAIIIVGVWGVIRWEKNRAWVEYASLAADIDRIKEESAGPSGLSPDEVRNITRLGSVQELLAKRFLWTAWFSKVELSTLPQVSLEFMQARDNHISMRIIAPDWVTAAQQLQVWHERSAWWTELKVSNSTFAPRTSGETDATAEQPSKAAKEVNYDINMTLSEDAWKP